MERVVGEPLNKKIFIETGYNLIEMTVDSYTPEVIKVIIPAIISHYKSYQSATNTLSRFRKELKNMGATDDILIETYRPNTSGHIKNRVMKENSEFEDTAAQAPDELMSINSIYSRLNTFLDEFEADHINEKYSEDVSLVIVDMFLMASWTKDERYNLIVSDAGKLTGKFQDELSRTDDDLEFYSAFDISAINQYIRAYNSLSAKFKRMCCTEFEKYMNDNKLNKSHLREISFMLAKNYYKLIENSDMLAELRIARARRLEQSTPYVSAVSDRRNNIRALIGELDQTTYSKICEMITEKLKDTQIWHDK